MNFFYTRDRCEVRQGRQSAHGLRPAEYVAPELTSFAPINFWKLEYHAAMRAATFRRSFPRLDDLITVWIFSQLPVELLSLAWEHKRILGIRKKRYLLWNSIRGLGFASESVRGLLIADVHTCPPSREKPCKRSQMLGQPAHPDIITIAPEKVL